MEPTIYLVKVWSHGKEGSFIFAKAFDWQPSRGEVAAAIRASFDFTKMRQSVILRIEEAIDLHVLKGDYHCDPYNLITRK